MARLLRHRNAALLLGVSTVSGFGGGAMSLTAGVWVMSLTGSGSLAALAGLCIYLPTLAGPLLGAVVDRVPRRPLLVWTCLLTAVALLPLLAVRSTAQAWLIYVAMLAYGVSYVLVDAGDSAVLPAALPAHLLGAVNGARTSAQEGTKLVAPLAGAALFTWAGGPPVVALSAAALAVSAGLYALVRTAPPGATRSDRAGPERAGHDHAVADRGRRDRPGPDRAGGTLLDQTAEGVRYLWRHRQLRAVVGTASVAVGMSGLGTAAMYVMIVDGLGRPAAFAGVLASVQGAGSILGGLVAGRVIRRYGAAVLGGSGAVLYAAGPALQCLSWTPGALTGSLLIGVGLPWTVVAAMTAVQTQTPDVLLGRVAATSSTVVFAPVSLALAGGAGLVAVADHRVVLAASAGGAAVAGLRLLRTARRPAPPMAHTGIQRARSTMPADRGSSGTL